MAYFCISVLYIRKGRKYCYGDSEGEYCHCDYCKCKHGYGLKVRFLSTPSKTERCFGFFCRVLNFYQHLDINAQELKLASFDSRYFMQILSREKEATVTADVVDTKGDEKTLQ